MYKEYDKPLHPPIKYKSMESEGCALNESEVDSAIAELLRGEDSDELEVEPEDAQTVFPQLTDQATIDEVDCPQETGLAATLRQKWAELRGAA